jgi:hypothetical protein
MDLEPIKQRLAAATPGPWRISSGVNDGPTICDFGLGDYEIAIPPRVESNAEGDAELVANATTDLALLVAEVERLRWVERSALSVARSYMDGFRAGHLYPLIDPLIDALGLEEEPDDQGSI